MVEQESIIEIDSGSNIISKYNEFIKAAPTDPPPNPNLWRKNVSGDLRKLRLKRKRKRKLAKKNK